MNETLLYLVHTYGYVIIFLLTFLECALFIGLFVPGETVVILGGVLAGKALLSFPILLGITFLGGYLGDITGYMIGRKYGEQVVKKIGARFGYKEEHFTKTKHFFEKWGMLAIIIGRFLSLFRALLPACIGTIQYDRKKFFLADAFGTLIWSIAFTSLGYLLGDNWEIIHKYSLFILAFAFLAGMLIVLWIIHSQKHHD